MYSIKWIFVVYSTTALTLLLNSSQIVASEPYSSENVQGEVLQASSLSGDANGDYKVDGLDYLIWISNYGKSTEYGETDGDFDNKGVVDGLDYLIWLNNYGLEEIQPSLSPTPYPTLIPSKNILTPNFDTYSQNNGIPTPGSEAVSIGIPECPTGMHNNTTWHPLYVPPEVITQDMNDLNTTDMTAAGCYYNHEHKANAFTMNDIFGDWVFDVSEGSIGYPWQTGVTATEENMHKHETYGYIVLRDIDPLISSSREQFTDNDIAFIRDLRIQGHLDLNYLGMPSRFHSSYFEVRICMKDDHNDCGIVKLGGHQDYEELRIDGVWIPLGNEPTDDINVLDSNVSQRDHSSNQKRDGSVTVLWRGRFRSGYYTENTNGLTPFNYGGITHITSDSFTLADPNDINRLILSTNPQNNNSSHFIREMTFNLRGQMADGTGRINFNGWSKRYPGHQSDDGCTVPSQDCIPIVFENVPALSHLNFRSGSNSGRLLPQFEYDTSPENESWIEYPN